MFRKRIDREQFTLHLEDDDEGPVLRPRKKVEKENKGNTWFYVGFASDLGFTIVVPIALGGFLGAWIDRQIGTGSKATLACLLLGCVISIAGVVRTMIDILNRKD